MSDDANSASDDENEECVPEEIEAIFPLLPRHFRCGSHTLNLLATTDFLKILNSLPKLLRLHTETMKKCNVLWKLMGSPLQKEKVVGVLGHVLRRPMAVRWNSLYDAVSQIVKEEKEILSMIRQLEVEDSLRERDMRYDIDNKFMYPDILNFSKQVSVKNDYPTNIFAYSYDSFHNFSQNFEITFLPFY